MTTSSGTLIRRTIPDMTATSNNDGEECGEVRDRNDWRKS
jgi:hypothetical protein